MRRTASDESEGRNIKGSPYQGKDDSGRFKEIEMMEITNEHLKEEEPKERNKNSIVYRFQQQLISAWRPVPSLESSIILYLVLTAFLAIFGILMQVYSSKVFEQTQRYDTQCSTNPCNITFKIDSDVVGPVFLYYGLTDFNQNHRFYSSSMNQNQLDTGTIVSLGQAQLTCGSKVTNQDMGWTHGVNNGLLNANDVAFPCGLIAYTFFKDKYTLFGPSNSQIGISQKGIAWPYDASLYQNSNDIDKQGIDLSDEHWLVWLRPAATASFYKLWGIINQDLSAGTYTLQISLNSNSNFKQRWVKLGTANVFGDSNSVLSIAYLVCAGICLVILIGFIVGKVKAHFSK